MRLPFPRLVVRSALNTPVSGRSVSLQHWVLKEADKDPSLQGSTERRMRRIIKGEQEGERRREREMGEGDRCKESETERWSVEKRETGRWRGRGCEAVVQ